MMFVFGVNVFTILREINYCNMKENGDDDSFHFVNAFHFSLISSIFYTRFWFFVLLAISYVH